ncbi:unnamed protein product [Sphenostylis stenocarpa]|uniref:Uncharacterized protein n=1 Tax=Sphenostylis stenocarpa TaxID=92480 RepID=A0AA86S3M7_9FABA|nr:unnamed protein product [Sphenostylis stenocarpa]
MKPDMIKELENINKEKKKKKKDETISEIEREENLENNLPSQNELESDEHLGWEKFLKISFGGVEKDKGEAFSLPSSNYHNLFRTQMQKIRKEQLLDD